MSRDKQIEEMAEFLWDAQSEEDEIEIYNAEALAKRLVDANYRKSTDVAREIDDIRRYIILNENIAKKCKEENGEKNEEYWKGKLAAFLQIRGYIDTELKKKYESEGE